MAYIGRTVEYGNAASQQITGAARPDYVLTYDTTTDGVVISLDGVVQVNGTDFNIVGTALTFTSDVASGIIINVIYNGLTLGIGVPGDSTITSTKIVDGAILNADVNASAAIAQSKLVDIVNADIGAGAAIAQSKLVDIVNADIGAGAAIVTSKLSGAVTSIASHGLGALASLATVGTTQIANDSVTGAKLNPALVAGDIIYADGTDTINRLAKPGTPAGEVLTFATSATAPSWVAAAGGGKLLQAVSTVVTATPSTTTGTWVDISGFAVTTGTLATSSSKLLIMVQMAAGTTTTYNHNALIKITPAGGSAVTPYKGAGAAESGDKWNSSFMGDISSASAVATGMATGVYLYQATSTVAHTIQIQWRVQGSQTVYLNRAVSDTYGRTASSVTVLEIGA